MDLNGRRTSSNVDDRRGVSGGAKAGMGIGGLLVAALLGWLLTGNPFSFVSSSDLGSLVTTQTTHELTQEEEELAEFSSKILASTEDVWTKVFEQYGRSYVAPRMVLFTGSVQTGCGGATSQVGPFYCSADQALYIDLSFFTSMKEQLGADGDFAYAYVIAHEVGHHVQNLLGTLSQVNSIRAKSNETKSNEYSVRLELQADFYAGVWGHYENKFFGSLEKGDLEEALKCAQKIGDDWLQKQARGYSVPESFTHGTSAQREKWLKLGLDTGDLNKGDTFSPSYSAL